VSTNGPDRIGCPAAGRDQHVFARDREAVATEPRRDRVAQFRQADRPAARKRLITSLVEFSQRAKPGRIGRSSFSIDGGYHSAVEQVRAIFLPDQPQYAENH